MVNDWILDVLADLRNFAGTNGFSALERQLELARSVAQSELVAVEPIAPGLAQRDVYAGRLFGGTERGPNA